MKAPSLVLLLSAASFVSAGEFTLMDGDVVARQKAEWRQINIQHAILLGERDKQITQNESVKKLLARKRDLEKREADGRAMIRFAAYRAFRVWTSQSGITTKAQLVRPSRPVVVLRAPDGSLIKAPWDSLSDGDKTLLEGIRFATLDLDIPRAPDPKMMYNH